MARWVERLTLDFGSGHDLMVVGSQQAGCAQLEILSPAPSTPPLLGLQPVSPEVITLPRLSCILSEKNPPPAYICSSLKTYKMENTIYSAVHFAF